jgi:sensor domain DACNV-containing protein
MPDLVDRLAYQVASRIRALGFDEPNRQVVGSLLETAYLGTMRSEEGRFVKGSLTFADPKRPEAAPPPLRRADYPAFTRFGTPEILNVQTLVKLACAIDPWSASIAVYTTRRNEIVAWGVVDQLVRQSVHRHQESSGGYFANPGLLTVTMDGIGDISAYHRNLFLGGLKAQTFITRENDALRSKMVSEYAFDTLAPFAKAIARVLDGGEGEAEVLENLFTMWVTSIARLCIGLRQRGTGGAFLLTPKPIGRLLQVKHAFSYARLGDAAVLRVLDEGYLWEVEGAQRALTDEEDPVPADLIREASLAEADAKDREEEMTGAVKLVASLAAVDGLVLMTPTLSVAGFGVKIGSTPNITTVYDGAGFSRRGTRARKIDLSQFGT